MIVSAALALQYAPDLRRTLFLSQGDASVFFTRPISATLLAIAAAAFIYAFMPARRGRKNDLNPGTTENT